MRSSLCFDSVVMKHSGVAVIVVVYGTSTHPWHEDDIGKRRTCSTPTGKNTDTQCIH
jgi:hypothetical protein